MNETFCISIKISLKFVPKGRIDNNPALVLVMAWRRTSDKPLSEPMLTRFTDAYAALGGDELMKDHTEECLTKWTQICSALLMGISFLWLEIQELYHNEKFHMHWQHRLIKHIVLNGTSQDYA